MKVSADRLQERAGHYGRKLSLPSGAKLKLTSTPRYPGMTGEHRESSLVIAVETN